MNRRVLYLITMLALVLGLALPVATPVMAEGIGGNKITVQDPGDPDHPEDVYLIGQAIYYSLSLVNKSSTDDMIVKIRDRIPIDPATGGDISGVTTTYWWNAVTNQWVTTDPNTPVTIPPDESWSGTFNYTIQEDGVRVHPLVDYNVWVNQLLASGTQGGNIVNFDRTKTVRVVQPEIELEKTVAPQEAQVGDTVTYTFTITNTGDWPLENITLVDDKLGDLTAQLTGVVLAPYGEPGDSYSFDYMYTTQAGDLPLINTATVTGTAEGFDPAIAGAVVNDTATAEVGLESDESIDIEKYVWDGQAWHDADTPTGPELTSDEDPVVFRFVITNDGNVPLTNVTLSDTHMSDFYTDFACTTLASFPIATLAPTDSVTVYGSLPWAAGQHSNTATAYGMPPDQPAISASDDCHYFGLGPSIDIEKAVWDGTTWHDADTPTGPELTSLQDPVVFRFVITNNGNVELTGVNLTDTDMVEFYEDFGRTIQATFPITTLAEGASVTVYGSLPWAQGQHSNNATATGTPEGLPVVSAEDWCHYLGLGPDIHIEKRTNGVDADSPPGPSITIGATVTWTYIVTNTGGVPLTDVVVTDNQLGLIGTIGSLAIGQSQTLTVTGTAQAGQYANVGSVEGFYGTVKVEDSDPSHYFGRTAPPPITVGWETYPVNKIAVLAPWIALVAIMAGAVVFVSRRRARS